MQSGKLMASSDQGDQMRFVNIAQCEAQPIFVKINT
jgi:hypothetical protein